MSKSLSQNPQIEVINSLLEDWKGIDESIRILIRGPKREKPVKIKDEIISKDGKTEDDKTESEEIVTDLQYSIENLPERHLALIQIVRRDNYYRVLNKKVLNILHWIVTAAKEALEEEEFENAKALTICWEEKMHLILQECYPNEKEFREALLDAVSRMKIMAMPGQMKSYGFSNFGDSGGGLDLINS